MRGYQRILMLICVVAVAVIMHGCTKKEIATQAMPDSYAPGTVVAYPFPDSIKITWTANAEAEASSGFGGYYVYCTTRPNGFANLQTDSLQYYQVAEGLKNTYSVTITKLLSGEVLKTKTVYYMSVRSMIDGSLSDNSPTVMSSPVVTGSIAVYAYVKDDSTYCFMGFDTTTTGATPGALRAKTQYRVYQDTLEDSTATPVDTTITSYGTFGMAYRPVSFYRIHWNATQTARETVVVRYADKPTIGATSDTVAVVKSDFVFLLTNGGTQVEAMAPNRCTTIHDSRLLRIKGRTTFIDPLTTGWSTPIPTVTDSFTSMVLTVGQMYQIKTGKGHYAKIQIDSLYDVNTVPGNIPTKKIVFKYVYQPTIDPYLLDINNNTVGLNSF
jgi:hypothetical protein